MKSNRNYLLRLPYRTEDASLGNLLLLRYTHGTNDAPTSTSWSQMDAKNIKEHHGNIYTAKVNGIIPWAGIHRPSKWVGGDPNPGSAFTVHEDGAYTVRPGYFMYKQVTRAGQPGMAVARATAMDSNLALIAFARNGTRHPDAFVLVTVAKDQKVAVLVNGSAAKAFTAFRTSGDQKGTIRAAWPILRATGVLSWSMTLRADPSQHSWPSRDRSAHAPLQAGSCDRFGPSRRSPDWGSVRGPKASSPISPWPDTSVLACTKPV